MLPSLGQLKKVDLREAWEHEATSFTRWLSKEENLTHLGDELGISIRLLKTEADVGGFKVDILAEEEGTMRKIIIENQLETTDHDHLGKLLTYASGTDANVIVWIFRDIRDEHRSAIDWLNEHTDEAIAFFAIRMELWQIGDSLPAPKFQIVSNPNNWTKIAKTNTERSALTPTKLYQFELWNKFKEFAQANNHDLSFTKTYPQHWYNFSIGSSAAHVSLTVVTRAKELACELYILDDKELFEFLKSRKDAIEGELGMVDWQRLPDDTKASRIKIAKKFDIVGSPDFSQYGEALAWLETNLVKFKTVFGRYLAEYK